MAGIFRRRGGSASQLAGASIEGPAGVDTRTKRLVTRLTPGSVAVIDHEDIDRIAAEALVECRPCMVLNAASSSSGRYPNEGPLLIVAAGIPLVDGLGHDLMERVHDGDPVSVIGGEVYIEGDLIARGNRQTPESIAATHELSRASIGIELNRFVQNTVDYIQHSSDLLDDEVGVPDLGVDWSGRQVLIVVRGADYREDLALLRQNGYLREMRPVIVAVDGGADALIENRFTPDVIVGDMDSVSEGALRCGAHLVVHAYKDGNAPGAARLDRLGLEHHLLAASGTSEDIAMLMAYELGADLIVAVGTHTSMVDFLDKGRAGMASTVLTRIKVGPILVDAKGVSRLYERRVRKRDLLLLVLAAVFAMAVIIAISEPIRLLIRANWVYFTGFVGVSLL